MSARSDLKINHTASVLIVIGTIIILIGQLYRLRATAIQLKSGR